jgi:putative lipoic acid-binding regulatory protein
MMKNVVYFLDQLVLLRFPSLNCSLPRMKVHSLPFFLTGLIASLSMVETFVVPSVICTFRSMNSLHALHAKAGSFFNQVGLTDGDNDGESNPRSIPRGFAPQRIQPPPDSGNKPFVGIGPPLNDITKPEYDDEGYTLYADERTGKRSRVFEALVEYPCDFTLKIVGANEGQFAADIIQLVAESCEVSVDALHGKWTTRLNGKWVSVTVQAPVSSSDMLYALYHTIDRDPRVKFKF